MVPHKAAQDFPVGAKCGRCHERASARDYSAYISPARPKPLNSRAQANTVLSAQHQSAKARGSAAKSAAHHS